LKYLRLIAALVIALAIVLIAAIGHNHRPKTISPGCTPYRNDKTVQIGSHKVAVELATTEVQRERGLGGRACITPNEGMLFIFDKPGHYSFWMKDMHFPIDIVWINTKHEVVAEEINVKPSTYPDSFVNKDSLAQYVLELQANRTKSLGMDVGSIVTF
jgi:uncharacterized protein